MLEGECRYFDTILLFLRGAGKKNQDFQGTTARVAAFPNLNKGNSLAL
jgi:hypothetical protein